MSKAVVIFSGGQDSTTCLYWALKNFDEVLAINFFYGQNHAIELGCAKLIAKRANVPLLPIDISFLINVAESAMLTGGNTSEVGPKGLPTSYVPNRNALFITLSHAYAQKVGADALVTGVCQTDYSGYPDCRQEFIDQIKEALNLGSDSTIEILTPLMWLTKAETFGMAESLGCLREVIEDTHTCYKGDHQTKNEWGYGCGECPACELRKKGYSEFRNEGPTTEEIFKAF